jgi:hypothetical protein
MTPITRAGLGICYWTRGRQASLLAAGRPHAQYPCHHESLTWQFYGCSTGSQCMPNRGGYTQSGGLTQDGNPSDQPLADRQLMSCREPYDSRICLDWDHDTAAEGWLSLRRSRLRKSEIAGQSPFASSQGALCKTVGLAYVGSNPTPATIKLAGQTRPGWAGSRALRERSRVTAPCAGRLGCGPCSCWPGCCRRRERLAALASDAGERG